MSNTYHVTLPILGTIQAQVEDCDNAEQAIQTLQQAYEEWDGESEPPFDIEWEPREDAHAVMHRGEVPSKPLAQVVLPDPVN